MSIYSVQVWSAVAYLKRNEAQKVQPQQLTKVMFSASMLFFLLLCGVFLNIKEMKELRSEIASVAITI